MNCRALPVRRLLRFVGLLGFALSGCSRVEHHDGGPAGAGHAHTAKHGGAAAEVGEEQYHIEFTYAETAGVLQAYLMDGELENYVRIAAPSFAAVARAGDREYPLVFGAIANAATGETVGDSALFEVRADWLAAQPALKLSVPALVIKGHRFTDLAVDLPAGKKVPPKISP